MSLVLKITLNIFLKFSLIFHQVVVFFLNYTLDMSMEKTVELQRLVEDIKDMQVNIVPVGIGENAKLSQLKWMATKDGTALHFGEYESPETLGTAVIQGKLERFNISLRTTPSQNNQFPMLYRKEKESITSRCYSLNSKCFFKR